MIKYNPRAGVWMTNALFFSPAYQALSKSSINLFHCLMNELRFTKKRGKRIFTNNGELSLTEIQFKERFQCTSQTYLNARDKLIKVGLIRLTYRGGMGRGDMTKYKILALTDLPKDEQRWLKYPGMDWISDIPKSKGLTIGKETRFKKGQSARKVISHPIELDPKV
jgi:hypothetical protein